MRGSPYTSSAGETSMPSLGEVWRRGSTQGSCVVHPREVHLTIRAALSAWWACSAVPFAAGL